MKSVDIALKGLTRSFRSASALFFMFVMPLLFTGLFYVMFGSLSSQEEYTLPRTKVVIANLDKGGPRFQFNPKNIPGRKKVHTMGELVVAVLQSEDFADLLEVTLAPDAATARLMVDTQKSQVAIIIPEDFSHQFADLYTQAVIQFYQDPTLTIGPSIVQSILHQFMDGLSGVRIAIDVTLDEVESQPAIAGQVVQYYLETSLAQSEDPASELLETSTPGKSSEDINPLLKFITPMMGGIMIFYAFYTGTASAENILKEEEERTLPRLFTTPTHQVTILLGKFMATFLTVLVQVLVLLTLAHLIFNIEWGSSLALGIFVICLVLCATAFGIFVNSWLKNTKQGGVVFGGILTMTGMLGLIGIFAMNSTIAERMGNTVSLLVPQGWAARCLIQVLKGAPITDVFRTSLVLFSWCLILFTIGIWRFKNRYSRV